jgi:DNA-binding NarL/FixJ family response regulator
MCENQPFQTQIHMDTLPKIALVEDHSFYRIGLCFTIKRFKFVEFAFDASNGKEFLEKQRKNPVDIVLMDIVMPIMGGYDTVIAVKKEFPDIKIIILTMLEDDEYIEQFVQAGVHGYLSKNIEIKGLETALRAVISGNHYYSEEIMGFFTRKFKEMPEKNDTVKLTKRESEILLLIYQGLSNQEIADQLFISVRTVTNHRFNLKIKTSSRNTASLIHFGLKNNLLK